MLSVEVGIRKYSKRKDLFLWAGEMREIKRVPSFLKERAKDKLNFPDLNIPSKWDVKTFFAAAAISAGLISIGKRPDRALLEESKIKLILNPTGNDSLNFSVTLAGRVINGKLSNSDDSAGMPIYAIPEGGIGYSSREGDEKDKNKYLLRREVLIENLREIINQEMAVDSNPAGI